MANSAKKPIIKTYEFEVIQDGIVVAAGSGPDKERMRAEAMHYAFQYAQDGKVSVRGSAIEGEWSGWPLREARRKRA